MISVFNALLLLGSLLSHGQCMVSELDELSLKELKKLCYSRPTELTSKPEKGTIVATIDVTNAESFFQSLAKDTRQLYLTLITHPKHLDTNDKNFQLDHSMMNVLNLTEIQFLEELQELSIRQQESYPDRSDAFGEYYTRMSLFYEKVISYPLRLRNLHLEMKIKHDSGLLTLLSQAENLEVLDLFRTNELNNNGSLREVLSSLENKPLRVLRLDKFQSTSGARESYTTTFDFGKMLYPIRNSPLQCLTLNQNDLIYISPRLSQVAPRLRIIDLSYNNIINSGNSPAILEMFLHPQLEVVTLEVSGTFQHNIRAQHDWIDQGHNIIARRQNKTKTFDQDDYLMRTFLRTTRTSQKLSQISKTGKTLNSGATTHSIHDKFQHCLKPNEINDLSNKTLFCEVMTCMADHRLTGVSCDILPSYPDILSSLDFNCDPPFKIPILGHHKEISIQFVESWMVIDRPVRRKTICFHRNQLSSFVFSHSPLLTKAGFWDDVMKYYKIRGFEKLEHIDFSYNNLSIKLDGENAAMLMSLSGLKRLNLQGNNIRLGPFLSFSLCDKLPLIENLDMSNSNISQIPRDIFHQCNNLRELNLAGNNLVNVSDLNLCPSNRGLQSLDLSHNQLQIGGTLQLDRFYTGNLKKLDLSGNTFICDCMPSSISSIEFIQSPPYGLEIVSRENYMCSQSSLYKLNVKVMDLDVEMMKRKCYFIPFNMFMTATIVASVLVAMTILLFIYRRRYRFVTCYYRCIARYSKSRIMNQKYDIYMSYSPADRFWANTILRKTLEDKYGFKVCMPSRDFQANANTDDEIANCMSNSNVIVVIISDQYIKTKWNTYEFQKACTDHLDCKKPLITIKLGHIRTQRKEIPGTIQQMLDSHAYTEWPEPTNFQLDSLDAIKQKQKLFWKKLIAHIQKHSYMNLNCGCGCRRKTVDTSGFVDVVDIDDDDNLLDFDLESATGLSYVD